MSAGEFLRQDRLNYLFDRLQVAETKEEIELLVTKVWQVWLNSGDDDLDDMMEAGCRALAATDYSEAVRLFGIVVRVVPDYAEAWNKRAAAYYLRGDISLSVRNAQEALMREPRHFGALTVLATAYAMVGDLRGQWRALSRLRAIYPFHPEVREQLTEVSQRLGYPNPYPFE